MVNPNQAAAPVGGGAPVPHAAAPQQPPVAAQAAQGAQAPSAAPAPPVFALGPGCSQDVLDYSSQTGSKIYFKATAPLDEKLDGKPDTFNLFLAKIENRAQTFGWSNILTVPDDGGTPRNLLKTFGMVTLANVRAHSLANHSGQQNRDAQSAEMLYHFLYDSLGPDFQAKVHLHDQDYTINSALDGVCLLKKIIMPTFIDTRSTTVYIRELLIDMAIKLPKLEYNVTAFNLWVETQVATLRSRGESAMDLLTYIWKAYLTVPDREFVRYIKGHRDRFLDGSANYTAEEIMLLADNYYKTRFQQDDWMKPSDEEEEIVALNAKISSLEKRTVTPKDNNSRRMNTRNNPTTGNAPASKTTTTKPSANATTINDAAWIKVKPKPTDPKQNGYYAKNVKDKTFYWCVNHNEGKGQWVRNSPAECRNRPEANVSSEQINVSAFDTETSDDASTES